MHELGPVPTASHQLSPHEAADLDLLLAGVLADGALLGDPAAQPVSPAATAWAGPTVRVRVDEATASVSTGGLLLQDSEGTPVAAVEQGVVLATAGGGAVVLGRVRGLRRRASGPLPDLRLDLTDPAYAGRAVLLLVRPPMEADEPELTSWAGRAGPRPLVLVPEGGPSRFHVPAGTGVRLGHDLLLELGLHDGDVRVVPLVLSGDTVDERTSAALVQRLEPGPTLLLTASCGAGAQAWSAVLAALTDGSAAGPLAGVSASVEGRLRRWRPRRTERGVVVLLTGLSGSGKSTLARDLSSALVTRSSREPTLLDGDEVRRLLSSGLGFDRASRELNVRRIGWVAARVAEHGGTAICSPIAPFAGTRQEVREMVEPVADFVLVHVSTPLEECERRDLKGLYARARTGEIPDFTGISSPYETPEDADVVVDTSMLTRQQALRAVMDHLVDGGWLPEDAR